MISIYDINNNLLLSTEVSDDSYVHTELKGDWYAFLRFSTANYTAIPVGSYFEIAGMRFILFAPHNITIVNRGHFDYEATFYTQGHMLKLVKMRDVVMAGNGVFGGSNRISFELTATPYEHLKMIVDCLNKRAQDWNLATWNIGGIISDTEKLIAYDSTYCWDALEDLTEEFNTEFQVVNNTISLGKVEVFQNSPLSLSYGKGNGLISGVRRSNDGDTEIGILYVQGGDRNIIKSQYGNKYLLLPPAGTGIGFDGTYFNQETGYDESKAKFYVVSSDRLYIKEAGDTSLLGQWREDTIDCSGIYPSHTCTISSVSVDAQGCYNVTISQNDASVAPYFVNNRIPDTYETIIFQTGELAGREFQVNPLNNGMTFQIIEADMDGVIMPSGSFIPAVGDTFNVYNITLPEQYVTEAQIEMFKKAVKYMYENGRQKINIDCKVDRVWLASHQEEDRHFVIGGYISFTDTDVQQTPLRMRIVSLKRMLNNWFDIDITLSTATIDNRSILRDIANAQAQKVSIKNVTNIATTIKNEVINGDSVKWEDE
ncbi:MAG: hypothetical protein J6T78_04430 [Bacteroidaceae bacterium]|nr:hypothetical protein [Bacteroidaceae bacterium]